MRNVHIYPSAFTHESRILREARTLSRKLGQTDVSLVGVATALLPSREQVEEGISIHRLRPEKGRGIRKAVNHLFWCFNVLWFCLRRRPSVLNLHSLPVLPIGVLAKWLTRTRIVYDAHELETQTSGSSPRRRMFGRLVERACMPFVDLLVVVSPGIERWYRERHPDVDVVTVLNTPRFREAGTSKTDFHGALGIDRDRKILLYQGGLAPGRGLEALTGAADEIHDAGYALVLMGYGPMEEALREQALKQPFFIHPAVPPEEVLDYTSAADIGMCLVEDTCLSYHLSLPNKLFEYVMARRPVVASDLPEIRKLVEGEAVGACITDWTPQAIVAAVRKVDSMRGPSMEERLEVVARKYCWEEQEKKMISAYGHRILSAGMKGGSV